MLRHAAVRLAGAAGVAIAQLRHRPVRTAFAVAGVALAVLAVTLLAGVGAGVVETGASQLDRAGNDLWISAEGTGLTPARGGGFSNELTDSHAIAAEIEAHDDVERADPMGFETVYVGAGDDDFRTVMAAGVEGEGEAVGIETGRGLSDLRRHYAGGDYDGEMTREVLLDQRTADALDVEVGDAVHLGGSLAAAREHEFTVVGISSSYTEILGARTAVVPLAELQTIAGTTERDPATFVTASSAPGAGPQAVARDLDAAHPDLSVRTNAEQLEAVLRNQQTVLVAGGTVVLLAVVAGLALTAALLWLYVHHQRDPFAALLAQGCSPGTVATTVVCQGAAIGAAGATLGIGLTPPAASALSWIAAHVVGYEDLVTVRPWMLGLAAGIALVVGTAAAGFAAAGLVGGGLAPPRR